ncbi:MAG: zinc ribbon domain-containing protein [Sarcina sp.]
MEKKAYSCVKCGHNQFEHDEIASTGTGFSRIFDIQNRKFIVISCKSCGYVELYKSGTSSTGDNILDFLIG